MFVREVAVTGIFGLFRLTPRGAWVPGSLSSEESSSDFIILLFPFLTTCLFLNMTVKSALSGSGGFFSSAMCRRNAQKMGWIRRVIKQKETGGIDVAANIDSVPTKVNGAARSFRKVM